MQHQCEVCHVVATPSNPVIGLAAVEPPIIETHGTLWLCRECTERREVASWPSLAPNGRAILRGLARSPERVRLRYVYVSERGSIHLLRMRAEWLHRHEAATA